MTGPVTCEWGPVGAAAGGTVVVVDVLSFTTSVGVAVERGTDVLPCPWRDPRAQALADRSGAVLAVGRRETTEAHPWSLSPAALRRAPAPDRLVLPSPNGSAVSAAATGTVVAASLRNAAAVSAWLRGQDGPVVVVPAGERWPDGSLRPALEDLLGAGLVLAGLDLSQATPEARAAAALVGAVDVVELVRGCTSGRELVDGGFAEDVEVAVEVGSSDVVPVLVDGAFRPA